MPEDFKYIRNRIQEYRSEDLLYFCFTTLDKHVINYPIWYIYTLIKWTLIYGGKQYPPKKLSQDKFYKLLNQVANFNEEHISSFIKQKGKLLRAFQILSYQQFYLQKTPHISKFYTQSILFYFNPGRKYNFNYVFEEKTGLSVIDFLKLIKLFYCQIYIEQLSSEWRFYGYFSNDFMLAASELIGIEKVQKFVNLLTLTQENAKSNAMNYRYQVNNVNLQTMEMTFLSLCPFIYWDDQLKLIDKRLFNYTSLYFIYDYLKSNNDQFTTEFGHRLEKYIELGLKELQLSYKNENQLKSVLPQPSSLVDFMLEDDCIYIECKASEISPYAAINPTDENLSNALKKTLLKAYFTQLCRVSKELSPESENWGIIITYKEYFWSDFIELFELSDADLVNDNTTKHLPPENVFIIDLETWDYLLCVIKQYNLTIKSILQEAKTASVNKHKRPLFFKQHLDKYKIEHIKLSYLEDVEDYLNY